MTVPQQQWPPSAESSRSEEINEIAKALSEFQSNIPTIPKNKQGYGYKFSDLADILKIIREPLHTNGLSIFQSEEILHGTRFISTTLFHTSGQWLRNLMEMRVGGKGDSQSMGAAASYARRYGLSAILGLVSDEDSDGLPPKEVARRDAQEKQSNEPITADQVKHLVSLVGDDQDLQDRILESVKDRDLAKMTKVQYDKIITHLSKKK